VISLTGCRLIVLNKEPGPGSDPSGTTLSVQVEYLVVGGYALAFHDAPRYTGDMDIVVRQNSANASRIMATPSEFGFGPVGLTRAGFEKKRT
jgi:hypothetical protein